MGLWPTQRNENHIPRHPRESGGPLLVRNTMDSRFSGNDVIFERAKREISLWFFLPRFNPTQSEIPRFALRKDDAYVLYIQRNRSDELASSFCSSWAALRLLMLGMTDCIARRVGML
jgi:hypothetical protein